MLFLMILTVSLAGCCAYAVWPNVRALCREAGRTSRSAQTPAASAAVRSLRRESLEGALVARLADGEITRRQYLLAMERIAERDDERHPLAIPPETGSEAGQ
jgi:cytochrome c biogenesis protein ResB